VKKVLAVGQLAVKLAKGRGNERAAYEKFSELMATDAPPREDITSQELVTRVRKWSEGEHAASTRASWYDSHLTPLLA
jgi:hypothetical protein